MVFETCQFWLTTTPWAIELLFWIVVWGFKLALCKWSGQVSMLWDFKPQWMQITQSLILGSSSAVSPGGIVSDGSGALALGCSFLCLDYFIASCPSNIVSICLVLFIESVNLTVNQHLCAFFFFLHLPGQRPINPHSQFSQLIDGHAL